jgi:hypothetical protein
MPSPAVTCPTRSRCRRTWLAALSALMAAGLVSLATAGSAAATGGTGKPITLNSQWWSASVGFGTTAPTAYFDDYGLVHLWGAAKQLNGPCGPHGCIIRTTDPNLLGTLPSGPYAPPHNVFTIAQTNGGTYVNVEISTSRQILLIDPRPPAAKDYSFVSLEGITYDSSDPPVPPSSCTAIQLNGNNWSPDFKFGADTPAACFYRPTNQTFENETGGWRLQGGVAQTTSQPSPFPGALPPNVIGTIPSNSVPPFNVYEIAHTYLGTYADLEIAGFLGGGPAGQIIVIGARPPAVQDFSFVSLEGINWDAQNGLRGELPWNAGDWDDTTPEGPAKLYGASTLKWYEDSAGIVHLEGGIVGNSCCFPPGEYVASLADPATYPSWNVFELAHTLGGTYAEVEIQNDGRIQVIPPRPPAINDYGFLSLDGITFAAASPKYFGLAARGDAKPGATVTVRLRRRRVIALLVLLDRGRRLVKVGVVHLGTHPAGRSLIHWNLRVNGRPIPPGHYQITLHALNGSIPSVSAPPGARTLVVLPNRHVHVTS